MVYAVGPITEGKSDSGLFGALGVGSTTMIEALKKAADDPKVVAIVLRIDSPGGSATASDLIWRETVRMQEAADRQHGRRGRQRRLLHRHGRQEDLCRARHDHRLDRRDRRQAGDRRAVREARPEHRSDQRGAEQRRRVVDQPFTPGERKVWIELLQETYHQFVSKAAEGRKMDYDALEALAQGRVYTGVTAKKLGLIDEIGTLHDAVAAAKKAAGLKADADVELLMLPEPKSFFEQLFGDQSASTDSDSLLAEGIRLLQQSKMLRQMLSQPVLMWMPYEVQVK